MGLVRVNELQEGMILGEDIVGKYDIIFLTSGTVLNEKHIESLRKFDLRYVYVIEKSREAEIEEQSKTSIIIVDKQLNKTYAESIDQFKDIYKQVGLGKKLEKEVIETSVVPLMKEITKNNNVLGRLRQIECSDAYTYKHSMNVGILSAMIGKWLDYGEKDIKDLTTAAMFHDMGKSKISEEIINKPGALTEEEYEMVKKHAVYGYEILKEAEGMTFDILCGVLQHHERMDGSGYPFGIKGDKIHEFAKIIAVADIFDAMTSQRAYKGRTSPFKVAELIVENTFGMLDPYMANIF